MQLAAGVKGIEESGVEAGVVVMGVALAKGWGTGTASILSEVGAVRVRVRATAKSMVLIIAINQLFSKAFS